MTNRRRILIAQLNTMRRLSNRPEIKRYQGSTQKLSHEVEREYRRA